LVTTGGDGSGTLGSLSQFTICGWLNARSLAEGPGGNRVAFALDAPNGCGFDLVQLANGALRIGINQWPDGANGGGPQSSSGKIFASPGAAPTNWVFFAVTYDPTLESGNTKFYFGSPQLLASLDRAQNYRGGDIGLDGSIPSTGPLTVGNFSAVVTARDDVGGSSRVFRGLIDELRVFDQALDLAGVQEAQMNGAPPPVPVSIVRQPASRTAFVGDSITFSVEASGSAPFTYQWQRGTEDIAGATTETYTILSAALSDHGAVFRVKVSNPVSASVLSEPATLSVVTDSGQRVSLSFSEGGLIVTNRGALMGNGLFSITDGYPIASGKVPTGNYAPTDNIGSVDFGNIAAGQGGRAIDLTNSFDGSIGKLAAFTVTGWLNARNLTEGWGGNRIVFALAEPGGPGFDLVQLASGALRVGVNEWPDAGVGGPMSSTEKITVDPDNGTANWVFFAVTYDSSLPFGQVNYYFGNATQEAELDLSADYDKGPITRSGSVTIGNFSSIAGARNESGPNGGSRVFRGLIDEINVFTKALTLDEIRPHKRLLPTNQRWLNPPRSFNNPRARRSSPASLPRSASRPQALRL
jgi:hypothetical protein